MIFKMNYGEDKTPVFTTDHSPIHSSYGEDSLNAKRMNVGKGVLKIPTEWGIYLKMVL